MLRRPVEAAHVLGKLLVALGPERIVWGTDCAWYGSPQPLIDAFRAFAIPERMQEQLRLSAAHRRGEGADPEHQRADVVRLHGRARADGDWAANAAVELQRAS